VYILLSNGEDHNVLALHYVHMHFFLTMMHVLYSFFYTKI